MNWGKFIVEMLALNGCLLLGFIMGRMLGFFKGWQKGFNIGRENHESDIDGVTRFLEEMRVLMDVDVEEAKERINVWINHEKERKKLAMSKMGPASV
jgi:hypothetical protein